MKAWILPQGCYGGPSDLQLRERASSGPAAGQVQVAMKAWSLNFRDLAVTTGTYVTGALPRDTVILSDGAGVVTAVGEGVADWRPGDRVCPTFFRGWADGPFPSTAFGTDAGALIDGVLAEEVVVAASDLVAIPDFLDFAEAACFPCAGTTAWHALVMAGRVGPGSTVLMLGTGGVSMFALRFAHVMGARTIVTSSSDDKLAVARSFGADVTINYRDHPNWEATVLEATGGAGADVVIEVGGPATLEKSMTAVAPAGTICLIGVLAGPAGQVSPLPLLAKSARLQGIYVGSRAMFEAIYRFVSDHQLRPVIDRRFSFDEAPLALTSLAEGNHVGKVVLTCQ